VSSGDGFVHAVIATLSRALAPVSAAASSPDELAVLLARLGWPSPGGVTAELADAAAAVDRLLEAIETDQPSATLLLRVSEVFAALAALRDVAADPAAGAPFDNPAFWSALPEDLLGLLVSDTLQSETPGLYGVLAFVGVLRTQSREADPDTGRGAYVARTVDWAALGRCVTAPQDRLAEAYGWGSQFDHAGFLEGLRALGAGIGSSVALLPAEPETLAPLVAADNPERSSMKQLVVLAPALRGPSLRTFVKPALLVSPLPPPGAPSAPPVGLLLSPTLTGAAGATVGLVGSAKLVLGGDFQSAPVRFGLRPDGPSLESAQASVSLTARIDFDPPTPLLLGGTRDSTRFELAKAHLGLELSGSGPSLDVAVDAGLDDAQVVIDLSSADGFVTDMLKTSHHRIVTALNVTWSSEDGLRFSGGVAPYIRVPLDLTLAGVLAVDEIELSLEQREPDGSALAARITGALDLGPFVLVLQRIGAEVIVYPRTLDDPGNFGLVDVGLGFSPPSGLGVSIDAEVVQGGGFIGHEPDTGRYTGAIELTVINTGIAAVGVLLARMPEVPGRWSMFMSLATRLVSV
jgi:hypothetical protein